MKCQVNKSQAGIKIARRNISNLRYANNTTLMAESEELKNLFDTGEREWRKWKKSSKAGLKLKIQKIKIMTSSPNTSQQIDGEKVETVIDFIFLGSKITVDGDGSHEMRRCLLLGRKSMTNLESILKPRDITLLTKVLTDKAMVFPVVMYICGNWTIRKAQSRRIDAFELWFWRRL